MSVVQQKAGGVLGATDIHETFTSPVTQGQQLAVGLTASRPLAGGEAANVHDTVGTIYAFVDQVNDIPTSGESVYALVGIAPVSGTNTVTADLDSAPGDGAMLLAEVAGRASIDPVGTRHATATQGAGSANPATCGPITALLGDDVLEMFFDTGAVRTGNYSQGAGFTEVAESGNGSTILDAMIQKKENVSAGALSGSAANLNNDRTVSILFSLKVADPRHFYSTTFAGADENPISEGGNWINGQTDGVDWGDGRIVSHKWFGALAIDFHDNTSILKGDWASNQWAQGTIFRLSPAPSSSPEVELRLRSVITANVNSGYEVAWGLNGGASSYLIVVRWNGPVGSFTYLFQSGADITYSIVDSDIIRAEIIDNIIYVYKNGIIFKTVDITTGGANPSGGPSVWTIGSPGMGHNIATGGTDFDQFGFTAFSAGDFAVGSKRDFSLHPKPIIRLRAQGLI